MVTAQPLSSLYLTGFTLHTRASYFAQYGKPAPPADPTRRAKAWVGNGTFYFLEYAAGVTMPAVKQETVAVSENLPNLAGSGPFPAYVIAASGAYTLLNNVRTGLYNPLYLSLQTDAQTLMSALGGTDLIDASVGVLDYDPTELRREWEFTDAKGVMINVGAMLFVQNMAGVGSPGHWDQSGTVPIWVSDSTAPDPTQNPWGAPCRALNANESIGGGTLGIPALLVDDGQPAAGSTTPANGDGSFTAQDRQNLGTILQIVEELATKT
jgi:hypothetical protein